MDLVRCIEKTPVIKIRTAFNFIACATVIRYGTSYLEDLDAAVSRIYKHLGSLLQDNQLIFREYYESDFDGQDVFYYKSNNWEECDHTASVVNLAQLLKVYNSALENHDKAPILVVNTEIGQVTTDVPEIEVPPEVILALIKITTNAVRSIFDRQEQITNETLDSIVDEAIQRLDHEAISSLIPEFKSTIRDIAKDKVTKGRPKLITAKKINAAIEIAEHFKDEEGKQISRADVLERLKKYHSELCKADRLEVAEIYFESKGI